ncbi:DUF1552 domain-containing protein [Zavarzinella formosa]|uniref:DUF1552 domain-containing protein n=1 Tax=Zavarzinella formosa TaxID=360055 RepID=UPI0002ED1513|nr:DUF1552 domain-containing protein [Zavarzinella formosa]
MHDTARHPLTRRAFLRGVGAVAALPFLEQLAVPAPAGKAPMRLGVVTVTGGTVLESWKPKEVGTLGKLPSILRPLESMREDLLVVSGLSHNGRSENLNGHENCALMHLTGCDFVRKVNGKLVSSVSIDQAAAQIVGEQTLIPSLEIGLAGHENKYSFRSADSPMPFEANPRLVFDRMFRGRAPVVPNWKTRSETPATVGGPKKPNIERSVADLVRDEANDLRRDLGQGDRHRLDEYLESVRAIEKRIDFVEHRQRQEAMDALNPGPSKISLPAGLPAANVPIWQITNPVYRDPEAHEQYIRLMFDLMVLAYQTDTTRVATFACGSDEAMFPGVITVGYERHCHTLEHQGNSYRPEDADPIAREACRQIHTWYTKLFAEFAAKLKAIDEGGTNLLDNTLLLYTSYMADGGHGTNDYPALLVGKAGGTLKTGRHLAYKAQTPVSNLYLEMLNRMGSKATTFGESHTSAKRGYDGRLPGLSS